MGPPRIKDRETCNNSTGDEEESFEMIEVYVTLIENLILLDSSKWSYLCRLWRWIRRDGVIYANYGSLRMGLTDWD